MGHAGQIEWVATDHDISGFVIPYQLRPLRANCQSPRGVTPKTAEPCIMFAFSLATIAGRGLHPLWSMVMHFLARCDLLRGYVQLDETMVG
jgi:hypothetical protein